jgi:hypothetical protein
VFQEVSHADYARKKEEGRVNAAMFRAQLAPLTPKHLRKPPDRTRHMHQTNASVSRANVRVGPQQPEAFTQLCIPHRPFNKVPLQSKRKQLARRTRRFRNKLILRGGQAQSAFPMNRNRIRKAIRRFEHPEQVQFNPREFSTVQHIRRGPRAEASVMRLAPVI